MKKNIKPKINKTHKLSERDITVVECLAAGYTDKETAIVLNLSQIRVTRIICEILRKTGAVNRPQLINYAYINGILKV